jgi:hypothetical protein
MKFSELKETITNINPNETDLNKVSDEELETLENRAYSIYSFFRHYREYEKAKNEFK